MNENEKIQVAIQTYLVIRFLDHTLLVKEDEISNQLFNIIPKYTSGKEIYFRLYLKSFYNTSIVDKHWIKCNIYIQQNHQTIAVPRLLIIEDSYLYIVESNPTRKGYARIKAAVPLLYTMVCKF